MKIVFTGIAYFGRKLVADLQADFPQHRFVFCDTYSSKLEQLRFLFHLIGADRVVSFNGVSSKSGSLDWAIRLKKKLIIQWHGTDVLTAMSNQISGNFNQKYVNYAKSFTDAPWLQEELKQLNIPVEILHFKSVELAVDAAPFPTNNVIVYFSEGKEKFYGFDQVLMLAEKFPDILFHVAGSVGKKLKTPKNILFYGWVSAEKIKELMNTCPVYLRTCEHDGYALSVLEALANGNYVIYNRPMPFVFLAKDNHELTEQFVSIQSELNSNSRQRRLDAFDWIRTNHTKSIVLKNYVAKITE